MPRPQLFSWKPLDGARVVLGVKPVHTVNGQQVSITQKARSGLAQSQKPANIQAARRRAQAAKDGLSAQFQRALRRPQPSAYRYKRDFHHIPSLLPPR